MLVESKPVGPAEQEGTATHSPVPPPVAAVALAVLDQCAGLLGRLSDRAYAAESGVLKGGTIGKHVRHTLDHFVAALGCPAGGAIEYDRRARNVPMETDRGEALAAIRGLRERLAGVSEGVLASPVRVRVMLTGDGREAELHSTLGRELAFAMHHAVHHHAMIKAMAGEFGVDAGEEFGRAPSTLNHERGGGSPPASPR